MLAVRKFLTNLIFQNLKKVFGNLKSVTSDVTIFPKKVLIDWDVNKWSTGLRDC